MPLSAAERKALRARAHALKPVVLVGEAGLSQGLIDEASRALDAHELIKVRLPALERGAREQMALALCAALGAEDVQGIGRVRVLYRCNPQRPAASRRRARARTPRARQR